MMGRRHQQFIDIIILDGLHALDTLTTTILATEVVYCHSFDITQFRHGNDGIFIRDHILHGNIELIKSDGCLSLITVFFADGKDLLTDHAKQQISVCQDSFQSADTIHQFFVFCFQLLSFQTGQCTKTHIYDGLCLYIRKFKTFHQSGFCHLGILRTTDDADHFIDIIQRL